MDFQLGNSEVFEVLISHCSGGHGDTFGSKGVFPHLKTALEVARSFEKNDGFRTGPSGHIRNADHGAFILRTRLNQVQNAKHCSGLVFARRFDNGSWLEEWFDDDLKRANE